MTMRDRECGKSVSADELLFFDRKPKALTLYEMFREAVFAEVPDARIEVKKTQISFFSRYMFAAVSFAPVRAVQKRPDPYLTISFGLPRQIESGRIDAAVNPYPNRWTHHIMIGTREEINDELLVWIREAADFAGRK